MNKITKYFRIFLKDKVSLLLGIGSLTIGIAVSLIIGLWYMNEINYDSFHKDSDNIYRICRKVFFNGENKIIGTEFNPLGKSVKKEFAEVDDAVRVFPTGISNNGELLVANNQNYFVKNILLVDTTFFSFFNYEFKQGNAQAFIDKPNSIIIDEQTANQIFPNENPMGKIISYNGEREVVAVLKNLPSNTVLTCHALVPIKSVSKVDNYSWGNRDSFITYIKLAKNTDKEALCKKMRAYSGEQFQLYKDFQMSYFLQPLEEIHLSTGFFAEETFGIKKGNYAILTTFLILGLVILLIACVNFINLFISSAFLRAKAIGLKKMNGATRLNIILDFISETASYVSLATALALTLTYAILPYFSQFIGYTLSINFGSIRFLIILAGLILFISFFAGAIPGLYMSGFRTLETLKGKFRGRRIINLQKGLVIMQFTASIALLIAVFFINKQIRFMNEVDLGFDKEHLIYINIPNSYVDKIQNIQAELEKNPFVKATTISHGTTLDWSEGNTLAKTETPENQVLSEIKRVQPNYFNVYGMKIIEGENTLSDIVKDKKISECLINEKAAESIGLAKPYVGKMINTYYGDLRIAGLVQNAYTKSLTQKIDPQLYLPIHKLWGGMSLTVKTMGENVSNVIELLRKQWEANESIMPFDYKFLDKEYDNLYKIEQQTEVLALWIMGIALFLTIAGLWGMVRYSSDRRTKEIGVRKVNGATIFEVVRMLNSEFLHWVIVSFVIAVPLAWYAVHFWLGSFVLRTHLSWWVFGVSGLIAVIVSLVTVSWQSWRAATKNPVEALRYE